MPRYPTLVLRAAALAIAFACSGAAAQVWNAQELLTRISASRVDLVAKNGSETVTVDTVQRAWVERAAMVLKRLSMVYGLPPPNLFITFDRQPNAFVTLDRDRTPLMGINTEMLRMVGDDENLLAAVVGHELGHLKANHLTDGAAKQGLVSFLGILAGFALDMSQARRGVDTQGLGMQLGAVGGDLVNAKFSRDQEREADDLGVRAIARAGFDPQAVAQLWRRMEARGGGAAGLWLDSHPSHAEREQAMRVAAATLQPTRTAVPRHPLLDAPVPDPWPRSAFTSLALTDKDRADAVPGAYRRGFEAQRAGKFGEAMSAFVEAAENESDERAMTQLGDAYMGGRVVTRDSATAYQFYLRAARKGFAPAIFVLGDLAHRGVGRSVDIPEAIHMFQIARQRGVLRASARLALLLHLSAAGDLRDPTFARALAQEAADRNDDLGKAVLGAFLRDGVGGPPNPVRGVELLKEATATSPKLGYAQFQLAVAVERGQGTEANTALAIDLYRKALTLGATEARDRLKALGYAETSP